MPVFKCTQLLCVKTAATRMTKMQINDVPAYLSASKQTQDGQTYSSIYDIALKTVNEIRKLVSERLSQIGSSEVITTVQYVDLCLDILNKVSALPLDETSPLPKLLDNCICATITPQPRCPIHGSEVTDI